MILAAVRVRGLVASVVVTPYRRHRPAAFASEPAPTVGVFQGSSVVSRELGWFADLLLILAEGRRSKLARDLARSGSKSCECGVPGTTGGSGLTAGARQIVGKPDSHALRAEAGTATPAIMVMLMLMLMVMVMVMTAGVGAWLAGECGGSLHIVVIGPPLSPASRLLQSAFFKAVL
ncbi:hypothetical protein ACI2KS_15250 [Pseudomonas sp. NPDC087358]|uniref:hypothetical protein n=1 Tax=Pseudomonas sp. NPDC087358 TaxID=3364439 RepID=UPI00384DB2DF